ncbi:MAG: ABC transporter permease [archaeon]|nr:ABC transporter permease [archaeon]
MIYWEKRITEIFAVAEKELMLSLRYKLSFFLTALINPILGVIPFFLIYYGFLHFTGTTEFAGLNRGNYIVFLLLGMLVYTFFNDGFNVFSSKFLNEKYWKTIEAVFISPISYMAIVIGVGLSEIVRLIPTLIVFVLVASFFEIPSIISLFFAIVMLFMLFLFCCSIGLIHGAAALSNENFLPIFGYAFMGLSLLSCFFYPIGLIPDILKPLVEINPLYHGVTFIRDAWILNQISFVSFFYVLAFMIVGLILSVQIFTKVWKTLGVEGY